MRYHFGAENNKPRLGYVYVQLLCVISLLHTIPVVKPDFGALLS